MHCYNQAKAEGGRIYGFPAILEYEFGDGDINKRGGGGLESHSKLQNGNLYRVADNKTKMADAHLALLSHTRNFFP